MTPGERIAHIRARNHFRFFLPTIDRMGLGADRAKQVQLVLDNDRDDLNWLLSRLALSEAVVEAARMRYLHEQQPCDHDAALDDGCCWPCMKSGNDSAEAIGRTLSAYDAQED